MIIDAHHHSIQFNCDDHPFDGAGVVVVLRTLADGRLEAYEPALLRRVLRAPVAGGPGKEDDRGQVRDATFGKRLLEGRIVKSRLHRAEDLRIGEGGLDITALAPGGDRLVCQGDNRLDRELPFVVPYDHEHLALHRLPWSKAKNHLFWRLLRAVGHDTHPGSNSPGSVENACGPGDLFFTEWVEGVLRDLLRGRHLIVCSRHEITLLLEKVGPVFIGACLV